MSELSLKIQGQRFDFFNDFEVSLRYNSMASVFSFSGVIRDNAQKRLFKPLSYHDVQIYFEDNLLITGTALSVSTSIENEILSASINGYSKPGVLEDCQIPLSLYPLQSDGLTLKQITEKLIKSFGLKLIIDSSVTSDVNKVYGETTAKESQTIADYLSDLAQQRNIVLTHDTSGNLVYTKLNTSKKSIATYIEGKPTTRIALSVDGQRMHSQISAQKQSSIESDVPGESTVTNTLVGTYRPAVVKQTSGDNDDTVKVASMARASELAAIQLTIETDRWKWFDGKKLHVIKPNEIIDVESPSNFINTRTRFFVESVSLKGTVEGVNATINAVLPEVYTGQAPKNIFA